MMAKLLLMGNLISFGVISAVAHSGGTDSQGGHYNHRTGVYHFHGGRTGTAYLSGRSEGFFERHPLLFFGGAALVCYWAYGCFRSWRGNQPQRMLEKMKSAAATGDVVAQRTLGQFFDDGKQVKENKTVAMSFYMQAAQAGDVWSQTRLGLMHYHGEGIPENRNEAFRWFSKAARQGEPKAQRMLGIMHELGQGVAQNKKESLKWYLRAGENGDAIAQNHLGVLYSDGESVPQSYVEAYKWFCLSSAQGNATATSNRDIVAKLLKLEQTTERVSPTIDNDPLHKVVKR